MTKRPKRLFERVSDPIRRQHDSCSTKQPYYNTYELVRLRVSGDF